MRLFLDLVEKGVVPDSIVRIAVRLLLTRRLINLKRNYHLNEFVELLLKVSPADKSVDSGVQLTDLPPELFEKLLGKQLKFGCCYWPTGIFSLEEAESQALELICRHARIEDGMEILELGCGWGSLTLHMAESFPRSTIISITESSYEKEFLESQLQQRKIPNVQVFQCAVAELNVGVEFDRVISIGNFDRLINYEELLNRIAAWIKPEGRLFVETPCHRKYSYALDSTGLAGWIERNFFTTGMLPALDLLSKFDKSLQIDQQWEINGKHAMRTAQAWLANLNKYKVQLLPIIERAYGSGQQELWFQRWKLYLLSCSELFGFGGGEEWFYGHYLLRRVL